MSVRPSAKRDPDLEKLRLTEQQILLEDEDDTGKFSKSRAQSVWAEYNWVAWVISLFLFWTLLDYDFPWPSQPTPLPDYVKAGIEQCHIIARPPPSPRPFDHKHPQLLQLSRAVPAARPFQV